MLWLVVNLMRCNLFFVTCLVLPIDFFLSFSLGICHNHNQRVCRLPEARTPFSLSRASPLSLCLPHHKTFHMLEKESLMCSYTFCIKRGAVNQGDLEIEVQQDLTHWLHITYVWQCGPIARTASLDTSGFLTGLIIEVFMCPTRQNQ